MNIEIKNAFSRENGIYGLGVDNKIYRWDPLQGVWMQNWTRDSGVEGTPKAAE